MKSQLHIAKKLLALLTPLVAGSAIAVAPVQAFTLSLSNGTSVLRNFNRPPEFVDTVVDSDTFTNTTNPNATVEAIAEPTAFFGEVPPFASNASFSQVNGDASGYVGFADSRAEVVGRRFFIPARTKFSFELIITLDLLTQVTNPDREKALASGQIRLDVFDSTNPDLFKPLDVFLLTGEVNASGRDFLRYRKSEHISIAEKRLRKDFLGLEQSAVAIIAALYHRHFDHDTYITITESTHAFASAEAAPEPSTILAIALAGSGGFVLKLRRKQSLKSSAEE
jgi:hypothetical protein